MVFRGVGAQLDAVLFRHDQCDFQDIDGIQAQPLAVQGSQRIDILGLDLEIQCLHEQTGDFPLQTDIGQGRRLLHERRFVGHRLGF